MQYKCDMCGAENISNKDIEIFTMPRMVRCYATNSFGVKLLSFDKREAAETHLCESCCLKIAHAFAVAEINEE